MTENRRAALFCNRGSGVLLHPLSLPGKQHCGTMGLEAYAFAELLKKANCTYWQMLPLSPPCVENSPYQSYSSRAGNPLLISWDLLQKDGLLVEMDLRVVSDKVQDNGNIDYSSADVSSELVLRYAFEKFEETGILRKEYVKFCQLQKDWLDDYCLFVAIKRQLDNEALQNWPELLRKRIKKSLDHKKIELGNSIEYEKFRQFIFFRQWFQLKEYCNNIGIKIIGDLPIYVSADSVDVWTHPELFDVNEYLQPLHLAGVPPDYYSETGQLWGNPVYQWTSHEKDGFSWWRSRLDFAFKMFDAVRIDHFRGFSEFWAVPADSKTAERGQWIAAPGMKLFDIFINEHSAVPVIAEDLGIISDEAVALREKYGFPGMKVLQFAFSNPQENKFLPHFYEKNCVVYPGTHDNNTLIGWFDEEATESEKDMLRSYSGHEQGDLVGSILRLAWTSVANTVIVPVQDLLRKNSLSRMNIPGTEKGNWRWRMTEEDMVGFPYEELNLLNRISSREQFEL